MGPRAPGSTTTSASSVDWAWAALGAAAIAALATAFGGAANSAADICTRLMCEQPTRPARARSVPRPAISSPRNTPTASRAEDRNASHPVPAPESRAMALEHCNRRQGADHPVAAAGGALRPKGALQRAMIATPTAQPLSLPPSIGRKCTRGNLHPLRRSADPPGAPAPARLTRIDPRSHTTNGAFRVGRGPSGVALAMHRLWVLDNTDSTVAEIDPRSGHTLARVSIGPHSYDIAAGDNASMGPKLRRPSRLQDPTSARDRRHDRRVTRRPALKPLRRHPTALRLRRCPATRPRPARPRNLMT